MTTPVQEGAAAGGLSVIIPNYNHAALLQRAVESHLRQTRPPVEVIVVDDCSTDDSTAVAEGLCAENPTVRLIRRASRGGPNAGIATGLEAARGEYVRFAGADDFVSPEFAAGAIASLEAHPQAAFCFSDPSEYDQRTGDFRHVPLALAATPAFFAPANFAALLRCNYFTISSNTVVFRREPITAVGGFPAALEWQADWFALLVLAFRHGACYRPEAYAHFSLDPQGYGSSGVRSAEGQRRLLYACLDALNGPFGDVRERFREASLVPPDPRLRTLLWLLRDARGRDFLTPHLVRRLLMREAWSWLRPMAPAGMRRWLRRRASA